MSLLIQAVKRSEAVTDWVIRWTNGLSFPKHRRKALAASSFSLAVDHHRAMPVLARKGLHAPLLALLRPAFEAYARGVWLAYLAADEQIIAFASGEHAPAFSVLCRRLAAFKSGGPSVGDVQTMAEALNHMTHGGIGHLCHRLAPGVVGPRYAADDVVAALGLADWIAINTAADFMGGIVEDVEAATTMMREGQALLEEPHAPARHR